MKDNIWIISLLVGLVVVLVIGGVSLLVRINSVSEEYQSISAKNISLEQDKEALKAEITGLEGKLEELKEENTNLSKRTEELRSKNQQLSLEVEELKEHANALEELMPAEEGSGQE